jgi:D-lactate dehydrogenase
MARQPAGSPVQRALLEEFEYDALDTCAADGSCQLACPVGIDTGKMVKELRQASHSERAERAALAAAKRWKTVEKASRAALRIGGPLARRTKRGRGLPGAARGGEGDPLSTKAGSVDRGSPSPPPSAAAVYVPSCTNRIFGPNPADGPIRHGIRDKSARRRGKSVVEALVEVSGRAGKPVWVPGEVAGTCCGLPFGSKGFDAAHRHKANEMVERLWGWSDEGRLPVVIDAASCTQAVADPGEGVLSEENAERLAKLEILDSVAWAHDRLLPALKIGEKVGSVAVHPTCATRHMGLAPRLRRLAGALADEVYVAPSAHCCGFAGDRGISHPELTAAATRPQAEELAGHDFDAHLSSNRACEIGLSRATGEPYESVVLLLERLTRDD